MARWYQVKSYLTANYACDHLDEDTLKLVFRLDGGRSQVIIATYSGSADAPSWLDLHSPIARPEDVDIWALARRTPEFVCGGVSTWGGLVTLRASVPLENLDTNEIEDPLNMLLQIADRLERDLVGADEF